MEKSVFDEISSEVLKEIEFAEFKHPEFPVDLVYKSALLTEEVGEATREANFICMEKKQSVDAFKKEVIQTACVCYRILASMKGNNNDRE